MSENIENVEPNGSYVRKISAQAEKDEKPIGRVKDMHRFLLDFEAKNKANAQRHAFPQKKVAPSGPRPWEIKKQQQQQQQEEKSREEESKEAEPKEEEVTESEVEESILDEEQVLAEDEEDDETISLDDFASQIAKKEESVAPATPASSQYTRIISDKAEADERPIDSVSELKQWLMHAAPGTDKKNTTLAATAAAERAERKLINELSTRMTREEAVRTARSYLRQISEQAVCEELPLMHVSEAQQVLKDFERKNREHFERSNKHPNKKMSRCSGAAELELDDVSEAKKEEEEQEDVDVETSTVEVSIASFSYDEKEGPVDLDESEALDISVDDDGTSTAIEEEEGEEESIEIDQPSIDGSTLSVSVAESKRGEKVPVEKEDDILEETLKTFNTSTESSSDTSHEIGTSSEHYANPFIISYGQSSRSLMSESSEPLNGADVFRKRYQVDENVDEEESNRPKKLRRGLDLLKSLACPNPVMTIFNGGAGDLAGDAADNLKAAVKGVKNMLPTNPTLTMTSSADQEDIAASRRNLGALSYEALESPSNSQMSFESAEITCNGVHGIKQQQHQQHQKVVQFTASTKNFSDSDVLAAYQPGPEVDENHVGWLEDQFLTAQEEEEMVDAVESHAEC